MRIFEVITPPHDEDMKRIVISMKGVTVEEMSLRLAAQAGYVTFTKDERGYVDTVTSLEGEPGFPDNADAARCNFPILGHVVTKPSPVVNPEGEEDIPDDAEAEASPEGVCA